MANSKEAKVLSPIKRRNKSGVVYQARISRVIDGFRKAEIVGTYKTVDEAKTASKEYIENQGKLLKDDLIETGMSLGHFFENIYQDWYLKKFVSDDFSAITRYLKENGFYDVPLQKINKRWCINYRAQIINFKTITGRDYVLKNLYAKLVGHLSNMLRLAMEQGYVRENFNERLPNPHLEHPRWESVREAQYRKAKMLKTRTWSKAQLNKYLGRFRSISDTQLIKRTTRKGATTRKANVMKSDNADAWKVYWTDNDGRYRSKNYHWKKNGGRERAKVLADAYAEEVTKTLEQSDGTYVSQIRTFREVDPIMWWAYFALTLLLGLRNGEVCGLKFSDIDRKNRVIEIDKQLAFRSRGGKRELVYTNPKKNSFRSIAYGNKVEQVIEALILYYAKNENNLDDSLLQYRTGGAVVPDYWITNYRKAQDKAGIPKHEQLETTHKGRHTHLSLLAKENVSPAKMMKRAGHKKFETTMQYYIDMEEDKDVADVTDSLFDDSDGLEEAVETNL